MNVVEHVEENGEVLALSNGSDVPNIGCQTPLVPGCSRCVRRFHHQMSGDRAKGIIRVEEQDERRCRDEHDGGIVRD